MKVKLTYVDNDNTPEEIVSAAKRLYGNHINVELLPDSKDPKHLLYFGIQQLITDEQINLMYDDPELYQQRLKEARKKWEKRLGWILNSVIMDNEDRF